MDELDYVKGWYARNFKGLCNPFGLVRLSVPAVTHDRHPSGLYDLQGTPQQCSTKSMYIRDGRKVVVR